MSKVSGKKRTSELLGKLKQATSNEFVDNEKARVLLKAAVVLERAGQFEEVERLLEGHPALTPKRKASKIIEFKKPTERLPKSAANNEVNKYLARLRKSAVVTQVEVSRFLGHSTAQYISNLERGLCTASVEMAIRLPDFYGGSRKELFEVMMREGIRKLDQEFKVAS